jgi:hypothetical protein
MHHARTFPTPVLLRFLAAVVLLGRMGTAAADSPPRVFSNPYAGVPWADTRPIRANLHTHTTYSDGEFAPHEVIDLYRQLGVRILALTDHDTDHVHVRPAILFPWTQLDAIFEEIKDGTNPSWLRQGQRFGEFTGPWENRDPDDLGMLAIPGLEVSRPHHISSLFCAYAGNTDSEETALAEIGRHGGLAVFLHPGRYEFSDDWYLDFYRRHPHLIGVEVFNQNDRCPEDRKLWDRLLHRLLPGRPVWGFVGDDMHVTDHLGWNLTILPLQDVTPAAVRSALESGAFYFYRPHTQMAPPSLHVARIAAAPDRVRLEIAGDVNAIDWITFDPDTGQSVVFHTGPELPMDAVPPSAKFARAKIRGPRGTAYTQPFAVGVSP